MVSPHESLLFKAWMWIQTGMCTDPHYWRPVNPYPHGRCRFGSRDSDGSAGSATSKEVCFSNDLFGVASNFFKNFSQKANICSHNYWKLLKNADF